MISGQDKARTTGRTRWARLALVAVPVLACSGGLLATMSTGALAASFGVSANSFTVSGQSFQISADSLTGEGFQQYGVIDQGKNASYPEALTGVNSAELVNLCQSVVQDVPVLGPVTMSLTAGTGDEPVHADRLIADAHDLKGEAEFKNIQIGRDASTVDKVPGVAGPEGGFALQSDTIEIKELRQETRSVSAATFKLPGLHLTVKRGDHSCF